MNPTTRWGGRLGSTNATEPLRSTPRQLVCGRDRARIHMRRLFVRSAEAPAGQRSESYGEPTVHRAGTSRAQ